MHFQDRHLSIIIWQQTPPGMEVFSASKYKIEIFVTSSLTSLQSIRTALRLSTLRNRLCGLVTMGNVMKDIDVASSKSNILSMRSSETQKRGHR